MIIIFFTLIGFAYIAKLIYFKQSVLKIRHYTPLLGTYLFWSVLIIIIIIFKSQGYLIIPILSLLAFIWNSIYTLNQRKKSGAVLLKINYVPKNGIYSQLLRQTSSKLELREKGFYYASIFFSWSKIASYQWIGLQSEILSLELKLFFFPFPLEMKISIQDKSHVENILNKYITS
ncbi:DUF5673 domain-containing protein [Pleurocapsa sp. PCC 7319]|uniref:DUF5673 domain-containing protein n=1 Tax=Pleurocapsa sp. PCC 7319 TaxID=118161 RepID=UPI0004766DD1|nr:DUF5673 domain-containing protein [Pleurocapsa sp. PCC 7319]